MAPLIDEILALDKEIQYLEGQLIQLETIQAKLSLDVENLRCRQGDFLRERVYLLKKWRSLDES